MFETYFGFKKTPFTHHPDSQQLFASQAFTQLRARLQFLSDPHGVGLLTGEVGSGKSTAARCWTEGLNANLYKVLYLHWSAGSCLDLLRLVALELDLQPAHRRSDLVCQISETIVRLNKTKKQHPLLILDEGQMLDHSALELLPLLLNFEMDSCHYLTLLPAQAGPCCGARCHAALIVIHHLRKSVSRHEIGSAFRGSSALHAVGDSYLLLAKPSLLSPALELRFQFRYAPSPQPRLLTLDANSLWFSPADSLPPSPSRCKLDVADAQQAVAALGGSSGFNALRDQIMRHSGCSKRTAQLAIARAMQQGLLVRHNGHYQLSKTTLPTNAEPPS